MHPTNDSGQNWFERRFLKHFKDGRMTDAK